MRHVTKLSLLACPVGLLSVNGFAQNIQRNDVAFGISNSSTIDSLQLVRGGTRVTHDFAIAFMQGVTFDNTDGFRHANFGNLLGMDVGVGGVGNPGRVMNIQTQGSSPGITQQLFLMSSDAPAPTRANAGSVSPNNKRLLVSGATPTAGGTVGELTLMTYNQGATPGTGAGASFSNVMQLAGVVSGNQTTGNEWLDNDTFITITHPVGAGSFNGQLQRVSVAGDNTMTATAVGSPVAFPIDNVNANTSFAYEPTLSPYVYLSVSQFTGGAPQNRLIVLDPANNFASVGSFDYSTSSNTIREISFDGNGNLYAATATGTIQTVAGGNILANLANNNSTQYYNSPVASNFTGADAAAAIVDYKTPNVTVDIRSRKPFVRYFPGTVEDPSTQIQQRLFTGRNGGAWNGTGSAIISAEAAAAPNNDKGIGYAKRSEVGNPTSWGGVPLTGDAVVMRVTWYGDTDLNGKVDGSDYARTDTTFNNQVGQGNIGGWFNGDFDYNGKVDGSDYALIDSAFNSQTGTLPRMLDFVDGSDRDRRTMNSPGLQLVMKHYDQFGSEYVMGVLGNVPEPTTLAAAALFGLTTMARRRRNAR